MKSLKENLEEVNKIELSDTSMSDNLLHKLSDFLFDYAKENLNVDISKIVDVDFVDDTNEAELEQYILDYLKEVIDRHKEEVVFLGELKKEENENE